MCVCVCVVVIAVVGCCSFFQLFISWVADVSDQQCSYVCQLFLFGYSLNILTSDLIRKKENKKLKWVCK